MHFLADERANKAQVKRLEDTIFRHGHGGGAEMIGIAVFGHMHVAAYVRLDQRHPPSRLTGEVRYPAGQREFPQRP